MNSGNDMEDLQLSQTNQQTNEKTSYTRVISKLVLSK
jgi:hypothetical protein